MNDLKKLITDFKKEHSLTILAHNYTLPEIQDLADITGDSLALARQSARLESEVIIVCGVYFMAETVAVLNPDKKVLIPDDQAGCPLADFADKKMILEWKEKYPEHSFVTYVNSSAKIKACSDVTCTSSNAIDIVNRLDNDKIVFLPDRNLGSYVQTQTDKEIVLWPGHCPVHHFTHPEDVLKAREEHPRAIMMAHPECPPEILKHADRICSTGQMLEEAGQNPEQKEYIIVTESGILHTLQKKYPEKKFIHLQNRLQCPNMKKITFKKLEETLIKQQHEVTVPEKITEKAAQAIQKMLDLS